MEIFKNYSKLVSQYLEMFPKEISVLISIHKSTEAVPYNTVYYRFNFSEKGHKYKNEINKKFKKSEALYKDILETFLDSKHLISLEHNNKKILNYECQGITIRNNRDEKLSLYFSEEVLKEYNKTERMLRIRKQYDFFRYCSSLIKKKQVRTLNFRLSRQSESSIYYTYEQKMPLPSKFQELEYFYQLENGCVEAEDLVIIYELICMFIDANLSENIEYCYKETLNFLTTDLIITIGNNIIKIQDDKLIFPLEKIGIIDNLKRIMDKKADSMSEENGLKLIRIKDES